MKKARCRIDVNLEELDRVLDGAREAPLSEADHDKLKNALHALAAMLVRGRNTEKTSEVLHPSDEDLSLGTPVLEKPERRRMTTRHRRPGTAAMEQRRLAAGERWISNTRS